MRLHLIAPIALLLVLGGCSSDRSDDGRETLDDGPEIVSGNPPEVEQPVVEPTAPTETRSELVGRWRLADYTLDDGTSRSVPDDVDVELGFRSDGILEVQYTFCGSYETSYRIDDGVLTTMDSVFPDDACDGEYDDPDDPERSELVSRALLDSQTMVAVSDDDVLTVATGRNEVLTFERVSEPSEVVGQWLLRSYSLSEDGSEVELDLEDPDSRAVLNLGSDGSAWLSYGCDGLDGSYSSDAGVLSFSMSDDLVDRTCSVGVTTDETTARLLLETFESARLAASVADGVLTLATPSDSPTSTRTVFEFISPRFTQAAQALVGRVWELAQYTDLAGSLRDVGPEVGIQFLLVPDSSRAEAFRQCVSQNGSYALGSSFVTIRLDGPVDAVDCGPSDPEFDAQGAVANTILGGQSLEGPYRLGAPLSYIVDGDRLALSAEDGAQLVFLEVEELRQQR